jgi:hypothetical protein
MRLSELLEQDDFRKAGIEIICNYKTDQHEYAVLGRHGQPTFPGIGTTHLIEIAPDNQDPEIPHHEELSIRRRLGLRTPPFLVQ